MDCARTPPTDASHFVELVACLHGEHLLEVELVAWRHALDTDPTLTRVALTDVQLLAHETGDDRLLVRMAEAASGDEIDGDLAGHLAYARAIPGSPDERTLLSAVPEGSCRYPYAQYRLSAFLHAESKLKSEVVSLRAVVDAPNMDGPPGVDLDHLRYAAILLIGSVYLELGRPEDFVKYANFVGDDLPAGPYARVLRGEPLKVHRVLPEAADDATRRYWDRVRDRLLAFEARWGDDPAGAAHALWRSGLPRPALLAAGGMGPTTLDYLRERELGREARAGAPEWLVVEARADLDAIYGEHALALVERGLERIGRGPSAGPRGWSARDFGW